MAQKEQATERVRLDARNVGGIDATAVEFGPGITVLEGRNATNRTSVLRALAGALGSDRLTLKADAETGSARLQVDGETYERTIGRSGDDVTLDGTPYDEDPQAAELFAFLFWSNEARSAVRRGADLRELIMRPVDTGALRREIERLSDEKDRLDEELARIDELATELPELVERRERLREEITATETELTEAREALDELEEREPETDESTLDEKVDALSAARNDLESVEYDIETERESLASLREQHAEVTEALAALPESPEAERRRLDGEIERLRERKQSLSGTITRLGRIVQFNEELLKGDQPELLEEVGSGDKEVTDKLLDDGDVVSCWTCGSAVERDAIDETLASLRELRRSKVGERRALEDELDELEAELSELESVAAERERLADTREEVEAEIERREAALDDHEGRRAEIRERIEQLEAAVERLRQRDHEAIVERQETVSELEFELEQSEAELAELDERIERIESRLDDREQLREERESVRQQLASVRDRIANLEADAVDSFNHHMDALLETLGYDNLDRVWIERVGGGTESGPDPDGEFTLHVVRSTGDGAAYEDTVANLSESEREVLGLVFALSGYLAHDVDERVPFMLFDSLEAIDSPRIDALLQYFDDHATYLVAALLPEDAAAVDADTRVTSI